jgi:23S rRNA pseudouridine2605 synthase
MPRKSRGENGAGAPRRPARVTEGEDAVFGGAPGDGRPNKQARGGDWAANARRGQHGAPGGPPPKSGGSAASGQKSRRHGQPGHIDVAGASQKLHKILAQAGLGSRRELEEWIVAGRISVNSKPAHIGQRVGPKDQVRVNGRLVQLRFAARLPRVLLYHKSEGEIVSRDDPQGRPTVFERLPRVSGGRWVAVGRLDFNTGGLLLFTTNGELANRLMHPRHNLEREYAVRIMGEVSEEQKHDLTHGIRLDDGIARFNSLTEAGGEGSNRWYRVTIGEGRNREVRRMFESMGLMVSRLTRVRYGPIALPPRLKRGMVAELAQEDVEKLMRVVAPASPRRGASGRGEAPPARARKSDKGR